MTTPDSRPVLDVIADAVAGALPETLQPVGAGLRFPAWIGSSLASQLTAYGQQIVDAVTPAVLAACQQATVGQQAELTGGTVETGNWRMEPHRDKHPLCVHPRYCTHREYERHDERVVGPWREDPS